MAAEKTLKQATELAVEIFTDLDIDLIAKHLVRKNQGEDQKIFSEILEARTCLRQHLEQGSLRASDNPVERASRESDLPGR